MNPKYAVLGATGTVGQSILSILSTTPNKDIHAFVRSKAKLQTSCPDLCSRPQLSIFEGNLTDITTLSECLKGTQAVFLAIGVTENIPRCSVAQNTARAVISALLLLRKQDKNARMPHLIVLSSATLEDKLWREYPPFVHSLVWASFNYIYVDLELAEEYLRDQMDWVSSTFVKPGGLVNDAQKGHALSMERQKTFLSFLDLAAGMVEIADAGADVWEGRSVSVVPTAADVKIEWWAVWFMIKGLLCHYLPALFWVWRRM
ncbi:hypothetical protein P154DRAFT_401 [Amniculicola lignicola CBS 123094]|uniref:NAD(P)-binding domain-containing protein n=1 Tax=Amniculicola lignicola CBS 123094 TaxID=1392246 RepID=A0A6A5X493_9PLEO|nr:hypothetical protein P154DRAFT_401 [Amniculicola lignicola CBS 123094]